MQIETTNPVLKERFTEAKEELKNLQISEAKYLELKAIPEEKHSFRDFVLVKVFEMNEKHNSEKEKLRRELDAAR